MKSVQYSSHALSQMAEIHSPGVNRKDLRSRRAGFNSARFIAIALLLVASMSLPVVAASTPARVAFLGSGSQQDAIAIKTWQEFAKGMQALGWNEGENVTFIRRYSGSQEERVDALAGELIAEKPDIIVVDRYPNARAVQKGTSTIPIVFINVPDPVGLGFVVNLARPGGNITGFSNQAHDLLGKGLQLLKETSPGMSRIAYLGYGDATYWKRTEDLATTAAQLLGVAMTMVPVESPADFDAAFAAIVRERCDAIAVSSLPIFRENAQAIAAFAIAHRLPTLTFSEAMAQDGLLLAQSVDSGWANRPAATVVDKILKGVKPADIPVEQPTRFHFVVNLKTARTIGISIPPTVLANADEVIE